MILLCLRLPVSRKLRENHWYSGSLSDAVYPLEMFSNILSESTKIMVT